MKITDIKGYETLATKADLKALELQLRELRVEINEKFVQMKDQFQRIKLLIWLPVITGAIQVLIAILKH